MNDKNHYNPWLHSIAVLTAGATFLLIVVGGIVTSTESGLAVPDWPTTFGYNMFLYPLSEMVGGILYEHSHRLMGSLVGLLTISLLVMLLVNDTRRWLKWLGLLALIAVIVQGILGGLRVTELSITLAILHACLAQAFFALLCGISWFTSRKWYNNSIQEESVENNQNTKRLQRLSLLTTCLIYIQLIFGALLRHIGSKLSSTLLLYVIIGIHILFALLITLHIFLFLRRFFSMESKSPEIGGRLPLVLLGLVAVQIIFGIGAYLTRLTFIGETVSTVLTDLITTSHVAVGALMLVSSFVITLKLFRFKLPSISNGTTIDHTLVTE
ncbi:COX15/CtaA family protein [Candidatus Poribacteria bacterium]|nr:COX15/CtaA family protein [Candidatus Poribacteria bacterium]